MMIEIIFIGHGASNHYFDAHNDLASLVREYRDRGPVLIRSDGMAVFIDPNGRITRRTPGSTQPHLNRWRIQS